MGEASFKLLDAPRPVRVGLPERGRQWGVVIAWDWKRVKRKRGTKHADPTLNLVHIRNSPEKNSKMVCVSHAEQARYPWHRVAERKLLRLREQPPNIEFKLACRLGRQGNYSLMFHDKDLIPNLHLITNYLAVEVGRSAAEDFINGFLLAALDADGLRVVVKILRNDRCRQFFLRAL